MDWICELTVGLRHLSPLGILAQHQLGQNSFSFLVFFIWKTLKKILFKVKLHNRVYHLLWCLRGEYKQYICH